MTAKDITLDLVIRYGFQVLGAIVILTVGVVLARWIGNFTNRWLEPRVKEPPMRLLMVRAIRILVLMLALLVALDKFGFQIAPQPVIGISELGDFSVTLLIQPWIDVAHVIKARAELYKAILERFRASKIEIPFPQREIRLLGDGAFSETQGRPRDLRE